MNIVHVEITDEPIENARSYVKDGKSGLIPAKQKAYIHQGTRYPLEIEIALENNAAPHRPGFYLLAGECFQKAGTQRGYVVTSFNERNLRLVPVEEALAHFNGGEIVPLKSSKAA